MHVWVLIDANGGIYGPFAGLRAIDHFLVFAKPDIAHPLTMVEYKHPDDRYCGVIVIDALTCVTNRVLATTTPEGEA